MDNEFLLEMRNISKKFGGVRALTDVTFKLKKGEIHALTGENGAGKSTLMKILAGAYSKDSGEIILDCKNLTLSNPKDAIKNGISVVYQEFMLAPDLTVAENIYIDKLAKGNVTINWRQLKANAKQQLQRLGFDDINPNAKVGSLSVAYQQVVEICKCLTRNSKILVLDEPTAVLTFTEIQKLFEVANNLKEQGVSIIYISHRLEEVFELCDRVTVLKDGGYVNTVSISDINKQKLVSMMVGREMNQMFPPRHAEIGDVVLEVNNLNDGDLVKDVSFKVRAGEIVGFSGLVGAGRTETMHAIFGASKKESGEVVYFDKPVSFKSPKEAIANGFALLPEDRKKQGLLLEQSIRMNTTLASIKKFTNKAGVFHHRQEKEFTKKVLANISTKYEKMDDNVSSLSGGNQQKVALAKWLATDCKCIVLDEPTRGVDVGAKTEIYEIMNQLAKRGVAIIMISSEMPEIIGMCDRVVVMRFGSVIGEVSKEELNENTLIKYAMGV